MAAAALSSTLGGASYALLEEAGVAEYVAETLTGVLEEGGGMEEIQEAVLPFLLDAGAVPGEEEGEAVCAALLQALSVGGAKAEPELKKLDAAVSMGKLVKADEAEAIAEHADALKAQVNINSDLGRAPVNSLIEEDESEEAMKRRFKQEKRGAKRLKRELRREKQVGMQREEFMQQQPVGSALLGAPQPPPLPSRAKLCWLRVALRPTLAGATGPWPQLRILSCCTPGESSHASRWCCTGRATAAPGRATSSSKARRWRSAASSCSRTPTSRSSSAASMGWWDTRPYPPHSHPRPQPRPKPDPRTRPRLPSPSPFASASPSPSPRPHPHFHRCQVGRNGIGKTTFLKFLAAARFDGVPPNLQILHIEQEVAGGAASVLDMVLATDVERSALLAEESELLREQEEDEAEVAAIGGGKDADDVQDEQERQARLLEIAERLEDIDARSAPIRALADTPTHAPPYHRRRTIALHHLAPRCALLQPPRRSAPARAGAILFGLGFDAEMQKQPTSSFSGGWRMRVSLARQHIGSAALLMTAAHCPGLLGLTLQARGCAMHSARALEPLRAMRPRRCRGFRHPGARALHRARRAAARRADQPPRPARGAVARGVPAGLGQVARGRLARALLFKLGLHGHAPLLRRHDHAVQGRLRHLRDHALRPAQAAGPRLGARRGAARPHAGTPPRLRCATRAAHATCASVQACPRAVQAFVDKNRGNASKASMAQSRLKAMSRLEVVAAIMDDPSLHFGFPEPEPLPTPILQAWACANMHAYTRADARRAAGRHVTTYCTTALTCLPCAAVGRRRVQLPWQAGALPARGAGTRHGEPRRTGAARTGPQPPWMPARPLTPP